MSDSLLNFLSSSSSLCERLRTEEMEAKKRLDVAIDVRRKGLAKLDEMQTRNAKQLCGALDKQATMRNELKMLMLQEDQAENPKFRCMPASAFCAHYAAMRL